MFEVPQAGNGEGDDEDDEDPSVNGVVETVVPISFSGPLPLSIKQRFTVAKLNETTKV